VGTLGVDALSAKPTVPTPAKSTPYGGGLSGRKVGRPEGSITTPSALLRSEMKATASTMSKVRGLVEEQLVEVRKYLSSKSDIPLAERLSVMDTCTTLIERLNRTMEGGAKYLMTEKTSAAQAADATTDTEKIIEQLTGGPKY
jgi:hypothetical protein